jgi:hypothetical protein
MELCDTSTVLKYTGYQVLGKDGDVGIHVSIGVLS